MVSRLVSLTLVGLGTAAIFGLARARKEITALRATLHTRTQELTRHKHENDRLIAELDARNKAWVAQQLEIAADTENRVKELEDTARLLERKERGAREELEVVLEERIVVEQELDGLRGEHRRVLDELRDRTNELESTRAFLSLPDSIAETDVIDMLHVLNAEISRVSLALARLFSYRPRVPRQSVEDAPETVTEEWANVGEIFGESVAGFLLTVDHGRDTVVVQNMIQAYIGVYVVWLVTSWHLEPLGEENILGDIYDSLRDNETQLVSGRWRELTRKHIDRIMGSTSYLSEHFVEAAVNVLVVAGATAIRSTIHETINDRLGNDMTGILNQVFRIKKAILQDITSSEMEIVSVPEEQPFESTTMETFAGWQVEEGQEEYVSMTTALGLRAVCETEEGREWEMITLLKPTVIVDRQLDQLTHALTS